VRVTKTSKVAKSPHFRSKTRKNRDKLLDRNRSKSTEITETEPKTGKNLFEKFKIRVDN
jgi:hypothetical protein